MALQEPLVFLVVAPPPSNSSVGDILEENMTADVTPTPTHTNATKSLPAAPEASAEAHEDLSPLTVRTIVGLILSIGMYHDIKRSGGYS